MKKNLEILVAALILLNVFTLFKLNSIQNSMNNNYNEIRHAVENTNNMVSNFTSNVNSLIEKQSSIIDSYEITFGEKLNENLTVPVKILVIPKEYTEGTEVSLVINDKKLPLEKDGTSFAGTVDINIFEEFKPLIVIEQDEVQKTESIEEYYDIQQKYLMQINGGYNGSESYRSGKYILSGRIDLHVFSQRDNFPEGIDIVYDVNEETVKVQNVKAIEVEKPDDSTYLAYIDLNEQIDLVANDKLTIYAVIKDKIGLNYKYVFKLAEIDSNGNPVHNTPEWTIGTTVEISDKDGNVLYTPDYLKSKY